MAKIIAFEEIKQFMHNVLVKIGVSDSHSEALADLLATGDYRGHYSHGLNRFEFYIKDIQQDACKKNGIPTVLKETVATAWVDGNNLLGPVVGKFCMDLAIDKAKKCGIGWVVAKGCHHFGIAGYYPMMALKQGLLGLSFTNASSMVTANRGKEPFFGTNPLALSAPGKNNDKFELDMATSVVALGKIQMAARKEMPIPDCWAIDKQGNPSTDPKAYHALLPIGGTEITGGYKGYGMAMLVEIFTGILGGAKLSTEIRNWNNSGVADLGQCFIAINPDCFAPGFEDRMSFLMDGLRSQEPADPSKPVLIPGDPERIHMEKCDKQGGIEYHANQFKMANELAIRIGVPPPKPLN